MLCIEVSFISSKESPRTLTMHPQLVQTVKSPSKMSQAPVTHNGFPSITPSTTLKVCTDSPSKVITPLRNLLTDFLPAVGEAHIFVNDEPRSTNISLFNSRAGYHKVVPMELTLRPGDVNTITFGAMGSEGTTPPYYLLSCIFANLFCLKILRCISMGSSFSKMNCRQCSWKLLDG